MKPKPNNSNPENTRITTQPSKRKAERSHLNSSKLKNRGNSTPLSEYLKTPSPTSPTSRKNQVTYNNPKPMKRNHTAWNCSKPKSTASKIPCKALIQPQTQSEETQMPKDYSISAPTSRGVGRAPAARFLGKVAISPRRWMHCRFLRSWMGGEQVC
jgi:hypothetical protein